MIAAYMYRGPFWHKAVIVAATFPITILMNSFRIMITGALVQAYGVSTPRRHVALFRRLGGFPVMPLRRCSAWSRY
ncbi:MAG: archaeosortase/exosortase family protein [Parvularculaceae bacterium]